MSKKEPRRFDLEITLIVKRPQDYSKTRLKMDIEMFESQGYVVERVRRVYP